jgi:hypothetical protein
MNQPKSQLPLINQPYLPQNAIVNTGTTVIRFSADVDHRHTITLNDKNSGNNVFTSPHFKFNTSTKPLIFNKTGSFEYFEKHVNDNDPNFVMNRTITVVNQPAALSLSKQGNTSSTASTANDIAAVGSYMVSAKDLDKDFVQLTSRGFSVDSTYTYKDARGGQRGTGPEQTLVIWAAPSRLSLDNVISALKEILLLYHTASQVSIR